MFFYYHFYFSFVNKQNNRIFSQHFSFLLLLFFSRHVLFAIAKQRGFVYLSALLLFGLYAECILGNAPSNCIRMDEIICEFDYTRWTFTLTNTRTLGCHIESKHHLSSLSHAFILQCNTYTHLSSDPCEQKLQLLSIV